MNILEARQEMMKGNAVLRSNDIYIHYLQKILTPFTKEFIHTAIDKEFIFAKDFSSVLKNHGWSEEDVAATDWEVYEIPNN